MPGVASRSGFPAGRVAHTAFRPPSAGELVEAEPVARKLLSIFGDATGITAFADALTAAGEFDSALSFYREHAANLLSTNTPATVEALQKMIGPLKDNPKALQSLQGLFEMAGNSTHSAEVTELLAHAWVKEGELVKARDLYRRLAEMEPENPLHVQNYRQVISRLGEDSSTGNFPQDVGSQALLVDELEQVASPIEQKYTTEIAAEIRNALTDSELFSAYNLPARAVPPLEAVLPRAPRDVVLNQRLLSLYARMGRLAEAAQCCHVLSSVYAEANLTEQAHKYADFAKRYRERSGASEELEENDSTSSPISSGAVPQKVVEPPSIADTPQVVGEPAIPDVPVAEGAGHPDLVEPVGSPAPHSERADQAKAETGEVAHEIDLSEEWERVLSAESQVASPVPVEPGSPSPTTETQSSASETMSAELGDLVEEIRFYISQGMAEEARGALARAEGLGLSASLLEELRSELPDVASTAASDVEVIETEPAPTASSPLTHVGQLPEVPSQTNSGSLNDDSSTGTAAVPGICFRLARNIPFTGRRVGAESGSRGDGRLCVGNNGGRESALHPRGVATNGVGRGSGWGRSAGRRIASGFFFVF